MDADPGVAPAMPQTSVETVEANGLRFHVAACGRGERLALCLHGFPESSTSWRHQLPLLARLGYRAWAPDLRGYGRTERPTLVEDYAIEKLLDDVAGLIDASGARSTLLIGHDWGAIIAWYFAMRKLRSIERLVIMNVPHPGAMERELGKGWHQRRRSWYALFFQVPGLPEWTLRARGGRLFTRALRRSALDPRTFPEEVLEEHRRAVLAPGAARAMLNYYRALLRGGGQRQRRLGYPVIETPTLMIWGEEDVALRVETTEGTERWVADLTLRRLPGVSHWVQQEAPEVVNAMLEAWLTGRPVPEAAELRG